MFCYQCLHALPIDDDNGQVSSVSFYCSCYDCEVDFYNKCFESE